MSKRRFLLPSGWYHLTITQAYIKKVNGFENLFLAFTVDSGEHAYQNVIENFPLNEWGLDKIDNHVVSMGRVMFDDYTDDFFTEQFIGARTEAYISRRDNGAYLVNYIMEYKPPQQDYEYDVTKEKTDEFYYKNQDEDRDLPIQ